YVSRFYDTSKKQTDDSKALVTTYKEFMRHGFK
ncbi:MAG TPA: MurR/RpiR family transcriptional regulator, partial [Lactobacillus sp.]|nr:MurR/RpiR family transcriptional regulator [Lactobacillus sp.]